jgi:oligopeptide transport system substrate-binding protein
MANAEVPGGRGSVAAIDFPSIPMWYGKAIAGWSEKVENVKITAVRHDRPRSVTMKA